MIAQTQLEIKDIFEDCQRFFEEDKLEFETDKILAH